MVNMMVRSVTANRWFEWCRKTQNRVNHSPAAAAAAGHMSTATSRCRRRLPSLHRCTVWRARCTTWRRDDLACCSCGCSVLRRLPTVAAWRRQAATTAFRLHAVLMRSTDTTTTGRSDKADSFGRLPAANIAVDLCNDTIRTADTKMRTLRRRLISVQRVYTVQSIQFCQLVWRKSNRWLYYIF